MAKTKSVERRKPAADRKSLYLRVRLTEEQMELFGQAAKHSGLTISGWATERLLKAARAEQKANGWGPE